MKDLGVLRYKTLFSDQPIKLISGQVPETKIERNFKNINDALEEFGHKILINYQVGAFGETHKDQLFIRCNNCKQIAFLDFMFNKEKIAKRYLEQISGNPLYIRDWPVESFPIKFLLKHKIIKGNILLDTH